MTPRRGARIVGDDDGRFGARYARAYSRNDRAAALSIGSATLLSPPGAAVVGALRELAHSGLMQNERPPQATDPWTPVDTRVGTCVYRPMTRRITRGA